MSILGKRAMFESLRSIDSTTFTGTYQAIGYSATPLVPAPLANPCVLLKILNNSNVLVTISFDGVTDNDIYPGSSYTIYDFGSDAQSVSGDDRLALAQGTQIWVKGAAPGTNAGSVYVVAVYQGG